MAALTVAQGIKVSAVDQITGPASEAIAPGDACFVDASSNGHITPHTGTAVGIFGIAVGSAVVGEAVTIVIRGLVDLGDALDGLVYNAPVYAYAAGALDSVGTSGILVGFVWPGYASTTADKILWLPGNGGA